MQINVDLFVVTWKCLRSGSRRLCKSRLYLNTMADCFLCSSWDTSSCWEINSSLLSDIDRKAIKEPRSVNEFLVETINRIPIAIYASPCKMWLNLSWRGFILYHSSTLLNYVIYSEKVYHGSWYSGVAGSQFWILKTEIYFIKKVYILKWT